MSEVCPDCGGSGFVALEDSDEDNCFCDCHHFNHSDLSIGWQDCERCALPTHEEQKTGVRAT